MASLIYICKNFNNIKTKLLIFALFVSVVSNAQSFVQSINSGSIIAANAMLSIGEIVVVPQNQNQSTTGTIGILAQVNQQSLEVSQFEVAANITVYPNPTIAKIYFESKQILTNQKVLVYDNAGKLLLKQTLSAENAVDLTSLASGLYLVQLENSKSFKIIKY